MEFRGLKINIIVLVIGIILISFFAGRHILKIYNVEKPLKEELQQLKGIDGVELADRNGRTDVSVVFQDEIDFYQLYQELDEIITLRLGEKKGEIITRNQHDQTLTDAYYKLHFAIYQGMATKEFVKMEEQIKGIAEEIELDDYRLVVDSDALYLTIKEDGRAAFYRIGFKNTIAVNLKGGGSNG